jgi:RNA polymerase sigma-70 factor, ECF subfamily
MEEPVSFGEPLIIYGESQLQEVASSAPAGALEGAELDFIKLLQAGEVAAFERLVRERTSDIYGLLYRLTEDVEEARDLTQETFLQAFRNITKFKGNSDLRTWLYSIAINQARNRWRWWNRRRRDKTYAIVNGMVCSGSEDETVLQLKDEKNPELDALARERERELWKALRSIGRQYQEAIILRDIEGLSYEEVAAALDVHVGTVKSRLARGRLMLRRKLESFI